MRLGDLDELKKAYFNAINETSIGEVSIINLIDNAPTVEPCYQTTSCLDCKMYDKEKHNCPRFCEIIRSAIEEKPQGEWLPLSDISSSGFGTWVCSQCGQGFRGIKSKMSYCTCGAKMSNGGAE